ncbi:pseudaminic acid synthase [Planktomarina temperata]|nr:pseudaminic acid synthase [bacterium]MDA9971779.1 pseudaminic acid synthase [Planktomarina temperata]
MVDFVTIDGRKIGPGFKPYVICELSGNHNGNIHTALEMITAAAQTGCDAIKLQTYTPDTLTIQCESQDFKIDKGLWKGRTLYDLYQEAYTPFEWHETLFAHATKLGVTIFSTPFDETATDLLDKLGAPAFKIASFEANDEQLISYVAKKRKPMIISTGLCNLSDIERAVTVARENGCDELILLHCVSAYPAQTSDMNLGNIEELSRKFDLVVGLSDHTLGTNIASASVALGASVIEKHFTLSRQAGGPDADFSLEPIEFERLCMDCCSTWSALGKNLGAINPSEKQNMIFRRSLYVVEDIQEGEALSSLNIRSIRPGYGLSPAHYSDVIKKKAKRFLARGTALNWNLIC